MAILTVGRVGLDVELGHPSEWQDSRSIDSRDFVVRGFLRAATLANANALRTELLEQQGQMVAVTYTLDPNFDGYYILTDARVESVPVSYQRAIFPFEVGLVRIGSTSRVELQSNVTGTVLTNSHGLLATEVRPVITPPVNHLAFDWPLSGSITSITRTCADGTLTSYQSPGEFGTDASWGCAPGDYYKGAVTLTVNGLMRAGLDSPNTPASWVLDNGLLRIQPETSGGNTTGRILVDVYGGATYESQKDWSFDRSGKLASFSFLSVVRNSPEVATIRLQSGGTTNRHTIDLTLRRGDPYALGIWSFTGAAAAMKVVLDTAEAGSTLTPTGASSAVGVRATSNDGDGNRYLVFTPQAHTADTTNGGVSVAATNVLKFAIGHEVDGTSATTGNTGEEVALQAFGYLSERVRAVWR